MSQHSKFLEIFSIPNDKFEVPSREYDGAGNLCGWYIEEEPAHLTSERLINLTLLMNKYSYICCQTERQAYEDGVESNLIEIYNELPEHKKQELKDSILDIFKEEEYWEE